MVPLLAFLVWIIHSLLPHILLISLPNVFKHLNSVTPKKYRWNSFLNNLTPISARKLKLKQTDDLSDKVVVLELEQLSMNDVQ